MASRAPTNVAVVVSDLAHRVIVCLVVQPNVPPTIPLLGDESRAARQRANDRGGAPGGAVDVGSTHDLPVRVQPVDVELDVAPSVAQRADLGAAWDPADVEETWAKYKIRHCIERTNEGRDAPANQLLLWPMLKHCSRMSKLSAW